MKDPRAIVPLPLRKRLTQAITYGLTGGWFSPQLPLEPQHQETAGRRFDYIAGYNISTQPRRDSGIDFRTLRNFSRYYDVLRMIIEKRKDQIANFDWTVVPTDEAVEAGDAKDGALDEQAAAATKFLQFPDGVNKWNVWLRTIVEDLLVLDAVALWPVYKGNQLLKIEIVDPSTLKLVIDESGRRPEPPFPAIQQILHGTPTANFLKDELLYFISNPASDRVYGYSHVERILVTVQIGLRREISQLELFSSGNIPAALAGVPDTWNMEQISQLQAGFDEVLAGNTAARRKLWFVPGETAKNIKEFKTEEATLKSDFDEWLIRLICFNFGISPTPFVKQSNRATAFTAQEEARDEGLGPTLTFIKSMMDSIIHKALKIEGVEFKWSMEPENDPSTQATIDDTMLKNGSRSLDELRQRDGLDPYGIGAMIYLPTGPVKIEDLINGTQPGGPNDPNKPPPMDPNNPQGGQPPQLNGKQNGKGKPNVNKEKAQNPDHAVTPNAANKPKAATGQAKKEKKLPDGSKVSDDKPGQALNTKGNKGASSRTAKRFRKAWHGYASDAFRQLERKTPDSRPVPAATRHRPASGARFVDKY